jgi:chromosome segregation ATPase
MTESANIRNFEAIREFKLALKKYEEDTRVALISARSNMQRAGDRLKSERYSHWKREQQKWTRKLTEAKVDLNRVQLEKGDMQASAVIERKRVAQAQQKLEEAERKLDRIRYWVTALERERISTLAQCQQLERTLEVDIPRLEARIEQMLHELEAYAKLSLPGTASSGDDRRGAMETDRMSRGTPVEQADDDTLSSDEANPDADGNDIPNADDEEHREST